MIMTYSLSMIYRHPPPTVLILVMDPKDNALKLYTGTMARTSQDKVTKEGNFQSLYLLKELKIIIVIIITPSL